MVILLQQDLMPIQVENLKNINKLSFVRLGKEQFKKE